MINKAEIHLNHPIMSGFLPSITQCFLAHTRTSVSQSNLLHTATGYPKQKVDKTVSTDHHRLQFADQENKSTLIQVMYEQMSQPHLSRTLRLKRLIIDLNLHILGPCWIFKHLRVKGTRKVQHKTLP